MRIDARQWTIGLSAAGGVSAASGFLQPWATHWMAVYTWSTPFCGSLNDGEEMPDNYVWVIWWTATSIVCGALAGRAAARGRSGRDVGGKLRLGIVAAAALASLTVLAALRGLINVSAAAAEKAGISPCLELSSFGRPAALGIVLGAVCSLVALWVREIAIGLVCGWVLVWAGNVLIGISQSTKLRQNEFATPFDFAGAFAAWTSRSAAQGWANAILLAAVPLTGLLIYAITRNGPKSALAAPSVHVMVFVSFWWGLGYYWG